MDLSTAKEDRIDSRYDAVAPRYHAPETSDAERRLHGYLYERMTWKPVEALLPQDRAWRILDAGGGGGTFGCAFARLGHQVTVLDISPGMVDLARKRFEDEGLQAELFVGSILALPFGDATFDLVFCEGDPVSYCLEQYPQAMRELVRVARPAAPVVLGVDSRYEHFVNAIRTGEAATALSILRSGRSTCPYGLPVHTFTFQELRAGMEAAGAEVMEIFGKPVLFQTIIMALKAERGDDVDLWAARDELLTLQESLAHGGVDACGGHYQVMARRRA